MINAKESKYTISLSVGVARLDCDGDSSIRDLVVQADRAMYEQKESHAVSGMVARVG
jgi:GGDEF domain-containing protein